MPPAIDGLVLPNTDGLAIDDEYTKVIYAALVARRRGFLVWTAAVVLVTAVFAVLASRSPLALAAAVVGLLYCVRRGRQASMLVRALRIQYRLITSYPWRAATLISAKRNVIKVEVDDETRYLIPAKLTDRRVRRDTVRHQKIWLCGPDAAGWLRVRGAGQVSSQLYRQLAGAPKRADGEPVPSGKSTVSGWIMYQLRAPGVLLTFGVLVVVGGVRAVHSYLPLAIGETAIGLGLVGLADIVRRVPELRLLRQRMKAETVTASLRLTSDEPHGYLRVRAEAEFDAPDGRTLTLRMPRAKLGLIANLRAGAPAALYGELAPGRSVTVVIAGQELTRTRAHVALR